MPATTEPHPPPAAPDGGGSRGTHTRCVLCGDRNPLSLRLGFTRAADGGVSARCDARQLLQGYDDILHGGVIAAMLDSAMTHCLFHEGVEALTAELKVRFVHPIPCGSALALRAWTVASHPPLFRLRAEIRVESRVMAWAEAKFVRRKTPSAK